MKRVTTLFAPLLIAGLAFAQEGARYTRADNPFQGEFAFESGKPIELYVDVEGVRLDTVMVSAPGGVEPGRAVRCDVQMTGTSVAAKKASLTPVVLMLEDGSGKGIERIQLDPFKVKAGKPFDERQTHDVGGDAIAAARKVYVLVEVKF
jgi:hypothetical protein